MEDKKLNDWLGKRRNKRQRRSVDELLPGILSGDRVALSEGITLVESKLDTDRDLANALLQACLPHTGKSLRIGITGVPGVGKSTFIEAFGKELIARGKKVAVLAVDPSSGISGGSILGDKTRMHELSSLPNAFIRPSAAGDTLGGVARKTRETIFLCEAAGFDVILIETVGVGQSETFVKSMVDFFLLLMLSGAGDELQGIKKGIMEMADALLITKADGDNVKKADLAAREYKNALHLFPPNANEWIPRVSTCSAYTGERIPEVWEIIESFENHVRLNGHFQMNRQKQDRLWLEETLRELILSGFFGNKDLVKLLKDKEDEVLNGNMTSFQAAEELYRIYRNENGRI